MMIRKAKISDVESIHELISFYAREDRMLFRSIADIYENIQTFLVAEIIEQNGVVIIAGCCALQVVWSDLAEVKSIAIKKDFFGKGIGRELVKSSLEQAKELGLNQVFTLTLEPGFFEKLGFKECSKKNLPMKVWSDCARCSKQDQCDETAMIIGLDA